MCGNNVYICANVSVTLDGKCIRCGFPFRHHLLESALLISFLLLHRSCLCATGTTPGTIQVLQVPLALLPN